MLVRVKGVVKNYSWGKPVSSSLVASLSEISDADAKYAELWFGSHPSGPMQAVKSEIELPPLPYLMKVLSVGRPLSIQAHPNLEQAERLHSQNPQGYPDSNQKMEAAIALSEVSLLAGFKSSEQFSAEVGRDTELRAFFANFDANLEVGRLFKDLMKLNGSELARGSELVVKYLGEHSPELFEVIKPILTDYPGGDVGLFCFVLLRVHNLRKGELLQLRPGVLHAYLSGDILECMTSSDNVVRAGLTQKFKDIKNLLKIVDTNLQPDRSLVGNPFFSLALIDSNESWAASEVPRVLLCLEGSGLLNDSVNVAHGDAFLFDEACKLETERGLFAVAST